MEDGNEEPRTPEDRATVLRQQAGLLRGALDEVRAQTRDYLRVQGTPGEMSRPQRRPALLEALQTFQLLESELEERVAEVVRALQEAEAGI